MAFVTHNIDGFKVRRAARSTGYMILVDGERTLTAWRQFVFMGQDGKMYVRAHYTNKKDEIGIGDLTRVVIMEPKSLPIQYSTSPKHFNAVMVVKAISKPTQKDTDETGAKGRKFFEQVFEVIGRDRKTA